MPRINNEKTIEFLTTRVIHVYLTGHHVIVSILADFAEAFGVLNIYKVYEYSLNV
jgi:hypothetical protein